MVDGPPIDFAEKRRKLLEDRAAARGDTPPPPVQQPPEWKSSDMLPDLGDDNRSDEDKQLDDIINRIDIIDAYNKWCGKSTPDTTGKREGIKISCPRPDHPDKNPSAWINLDKQTWYCAACDEGGDSYDIAAYSFGYPVPGYKEGQTFHKLRKQMAEAFGWQFKKVPGGQVIYQDTPPEAPPAPPQPPQPPSPPVSDPGLKVAPAPEGTSDQGSTPSVEPSEQDEADNVSQMWAEDDEEDVVIYPTINWRNLIPEDTFLHEYMGACSNDDSPEEYHFWHGLLALGHAVGRKVTLDDHRPVYSNLLVCLLGATGTGKSRSRGWLDIVLKNAVPYHEDGAATTGCKLIPVPSSGEYLVSAFSYEGKDLSGGKASLGFQPVNGVVDFDEMSALLARANRQGSTLKPTIMALADARDEVKIGGLQRGDFIASMPFCSITASTQPRAIRTLLNRTDTGSGFLNRWIFAGGKQKQTESLGGGHSSTVIDLDAAIDLLKKVRGWGAVERSLMLDQDAYDRFNSYFHAKLEPMKSKDDTDLLKRIDLMSKKLMLLFTINKRGKTVDLQSVEAMIEVMDYVIECFGILNSNIGITVMQDVMNEIQRHILRHLKNTGRGASARDIMKYTKRKNFSLEQIKKALEVMTALDIIELVKPESGKVGRPTIRYKVVGE